MCSKLQVTNENFVFNSEKMLEKLSSPKSKSNFMKRNSAGIDWNDKLKEQRTWIRLKINTTNNFFLLFLSSGRFCHKIMRTTDSKATSSLYTDIKLDTNKFGRTNKSSWSNYNLPTSPKITFVIKSGMTVKWYPILFK